MAFLGVVNLALDLLLGGSLLKVLVEFAVGFLGGMLMFAEIELAMASRNANSMEKCFCDAHLHRGFAGGFELGARDCCAFAS